MTERCVVPGRFRKIILYFFSKSVNDALLALRGLILANFLGPEAFGGWVLFRLCTSYCGFAHLGVPNGLEFHVAQAPNQEGGFRGVFYWRSALGFVLVVFGVISLFAICASFFVDDLSLSLGLRWFAGAILTEQLWLLGLSYLRARGNLRDYAIFEVTNAALQMIFALVLAPIWGLSGAFASFVLATTVSLVLLLRPLPKIPAWSWVRLKKILKVGFPILASLVIGFTLASADRLIVAGNGDMALLGLYGFAFSIAGIAGSPAWVIRVVVYPDVYAGVATEGEGPALEDHLKGIVLPFARIIPPMIGLIALLIGPVISFAVPQYVNAIPSARILMFIGVTSGFERLGSLGVVAAKRQRFLPLFSGGGLLLNVTLSILALRSDFGLQGVAGAALISNAMFGIATMALLAGLAKATKPVTYLLRMVFPLTWCLMSVLVLGNFCIEPKFTSCLGSFGLYVLAILPLVPGALSEMRKLR